MQTQDWIKENVIALTGNIATGKSTVARILASHGVTVIDADQLARAVVKKGQPTLETILKAFAQSPAEEKTLLDENGDLNRQKMAEIIFKNPEKWLALENILHPAIAQAFEQQCIALSQTPSPWYVVYEASLIIEAGKKNLFREVWMTRCQPETQLKRLMERSQGRLTEQEAKLRIRSQMPPEDKQQHCHFIIDTDGHLPVERLLQRLRK